MVGTSERRTAFVTGGASGIGRATAQAFLERGYAVVLADRNEALGRSAAAELAALGDCRFVACDVADDESVGAAVASAIEAYGRIDAAFNAAGIGGELSSTIDGTIENWNQVIAINLTGVWFCMRRQIRHMLEAGGGTIVNCASLGGLQGAPGLHAYTAAKHGVVGLTRTAALEYAKQGVRINAVCPGMTETPMSQHMPKDAVDAMNAVNPMGRFARPEEIASAVLWLCDPANSYVTGQALAVDGGWSAG
jgi:NAD(P)-dependent dehydrogenase (short-subunit alcohol dehydrogenase family)